ncbi:SGNH/GDSL hydrolase family protein [Actinomycetospora lemnae]|uniref:SGNH/GDSL hydrolase family protein n=1 Tax=Actinomycetospora lemnae TaxID=3019891 RepID=A0ABT5SVB2_9PSEU|nr:SGNH/GDSL hydrolase family protein [Actinomycetospora sp. DW7H6]MDD7966794.1 SGNH/GDSL hydrolase family protein [Actinomycetospora sp. DW7H6]
MVLGDSYTAGYGLRHAATEGWATRLGLARHWTTYVDGVGNSGLTSGGPCGDSYYLNRIPEVLAHGPRTIVVQGSLNDLETDSAALAAAADQLLEAVADVPEVVVLGPVTLPRVGGAERIDDILHEAADRADRRYIPLLDLRLPMQEDGMHPTPEGHAMLAAAVADRLG